MGFVESRKKDYDACLLNNEEKQKRNAVHVSGANESQTAHRSILDVEEERKTREEQLQKEMWCEMDRVKR